MNPNKLLACALGFILAGCTQSLNLDDLLPTKTIEIEKPPIFHPPLPRPTKLSALGPWVVVGDSPHPYCLSVKDYETLADNQAQQQRWIRDAIDLLRYYRTLE